MSIKLNAFLFFAFHLLNLGEKKKFSFSGVLAVTDEIGMTPRKLL